MSTGDAADANGGGDKQRRRKRRWGDATPAQGDPPVAAVAAVAPIAAIDSKAKALALQESIKARLAALKARTGGGGGGGGAAAAATSGLPPPPAPSKATTSLKRPLPTSSTTRSASATAPPTKRAKHYDLDLSVTAPTFSRENPDPPKPKVNPYLAHKVVVVPDLGPTTKNKAAERSAVKQESTDVAGGGGGGGGRAELEQDLEAIEDLEAVDDRVQATKFRKRHKRLSFVEPGTFVEIAERKRQRAANAEASGFHSGRKAGTYYQAQTMANIYGSTDVVVDDSILGVRPEFDDKTTLPSIIEWWDMELLPSKLKKQVTLEEGKVLQTETRQALTVAASDAQKAHRKLELLTQDPAAQDLQQACWDQAALSYSKTAALIQHIVPIKPPHAKDGPAVEPTLYLTKKERKRQRKLRRQEKQRDLQDLQAAGLASAPEPRLTLKNFIRVLGDQAFVDPSQMEQKVMAQMEVRQRAHLARNASNKLTKEQRTAKLAKKLQEDTTGGVHVALFYVKDISHPYHRTKVDLNAQQYNITGGVIESDANPKLACVICEGGPKAIKRYTRLMTVRMKWKGPDNYEEEDDDDVDDEGEPRPKFNPENECALVWTGMTTKRFFKGFLFQACESGMEAAKILRAKGVGYYWDQILAHASGQGDPLAFQLKLVQGGGGDDDDSNDNDDNEHPASGGEGGVKEVAIPMEE